MRTEYVIEFHLPEALQDRLDDNGKKTALEINTFVAAIVAAGLAERGVSRPGERYGIMVKHRTIPDEEEHVHLDS